MFPNPVINKLAIFGGSYLYIIIILIAVAYFLHLPKEKKAEMVVFSFFTLPLILLVAKIGNALWQNPRPFVVGHFTPLIPHSSDNGFPSDHTLLASAVAMIVVFFNQKLGATLWLLATLVGLSRVYAGVHHTIDIIGSITISLVITAFFHRYALPAILKSAWYQKLWQKISPTIEKS